MTIFQILGVLGSTLAALLVFRAAARRRISPAAGAFWALLWTGAAIFIARPDWTLVVSRLLGIARGADLVFYCAVLGGMLAFLALYLRLRRIEGQITRLVREIALARADEEDDPPAKP